MNNQLAIVDVLIVVLYLAGTTVLGAWFARQQRDIKTYFVGDRNVAWWLVLASIVATETSTVTFLSAPGLAFKQGGNFTFLQLTLGYIIGRTVIAFVLLPQYLRGQLFTAYQLLRERFSPTVQRTASSLFLFTRTIADGLRLYLTGLLLHLFTGWNIETSILVMGVTTVVYTYLGGMQAVIWTDLIQFVIYILGAIVAAGFILWMLPGGWNGYLTIGLEHHKFTAVNLSPDPRQTYTLWTGMIGGAIFTMASHGADQLMVQRYLCSRSLGEARLALIASGVVVMLQFLLFLGIGVGLFALQDRGVLTQESAPDYALQDEKGPDGKPTGQKVFKGDAVFGHFISKFLSGGPAGLVVAAVLAAAMSTLSSSLNSSASAFVNDFYRPLRPDRSAGHYLSVSRWTTSFWGVAQVGVALIAVGVRQDQSVIDQVLGVAGITTGLVLGLFLLGSLRLRRPIRSSSALFGLLVGFAAVMLVWTPTLPILGQVGFLSRWKLPITIVAWPWYAPIGAGATMAAAFIANYMGYYGSSNHGNSESSIKPAG